MEVVEEVVVFLRACLLQHITMETEVDEKTTGTMQTVAVLFAILCVSYSVWLK